jgi:hypothetical protein
MARGRSPLPTIDLESLGLDQGGHLLINEALRRVPVGGRVDVVGSDPNLRLHLLAWARSQGHQVEGPSGLAYEARHVEVFTRRGLLRGGPLGTSGVGGRASLQTLLDEPDFPAASLLLSVLGEGAFLNLLSFLETHAPDPVTRRISHLALQDESRHVAFGMGHLQHHLAAEPDLLGRLAAAVERRHDALSHTAGLNADTFDALVVLAAGDWSPAAIASGWARVAGLQADMEDGRRRRLVRLGFPPARAERLAALHTRNFM